MAQRKNAVKGMTLAEILIAATIGLFLMGTVVSIWSFSYRNWASERAISRSKINLEVAIERIKQEFRISSATYLSGFPIGAASFTAISFPATTPGALGYFPLAAGFINWDKSVIYHLYSNAATGHTELRRTEFTANGAVLFNQATRDLQLTLIAQNGDNSDAATPNRDNATTTTIVPRGVENVDVDFIVTPADQGFDGFNATTERLNVSFGAINLTPGMHTLTFDVIGQNALSAGFGLGIDTLSITPSGCEREVEVYENHATLLDTISASSDGALAQVQVGPDDAWSGRRYFQYNADGIADFISFDFYNDLWRESNFRNSQRVNTELMTRTNLVGDDRYVGLQDLEEGREATWQASDQTGGGKMVYNDIALSPINFDDITVRNRISADAIDVEGDLLRIGFDSNSSATSNPLAITSAYLDLVDVTGTAIESRTQLFFTTNIGGEIVDTGVGGVTPGGTVPVNSSRFSNWAILSFDPARNYVLTFHVDSGSNSHISYWPGAATAFHSFLIAGDDTASQLALPPPGATDDRKGFAPPSELPPPALPPPAMPFTETSNIYAVSSIEVWPGSGSVTSEIYDTTLAAPAYNQIRWTEFLPANSTIELEAASGAGMAMAPNWSIIVGSSTNPGNLAIGAGRFVQFRAEMALGLVWTCYAHPVVSVSDAAYQISNICTVAGCSNFLLPAVDYLERIGADYCPWVDNVTIDWPGVTTICEISGNFLKDPNYGVVSLSVDGQALTKGIELEVSVTEDVRGKIYESSLTAAIEPRNTGR